MGYEIVNFLRISPKAKNTKTGEIATFPLFHVLVEKIDKNDFAATAMEYFQVSTASTPEDAVVKLYSNMIRYFITMIDRNGHESLHEVAKADDYSALWGRIREYATRKFEDDLKYVSMTIKGGYSEEEISEQAKLLKSRTSPEQLFVTKEDHDQKIKEKDVEISIKDGVIKKIYERYETLYKENEELKRKAEVDISSTSWNIEIEDTISESNAVCH